MAQNSKFEFQGVRLDIPANQQIITDESGKRQLLVEKLGQPFRCETDEKKSTASFWLAIDLDGKTPGRLSTKLVLS